MKGKIALVLLVMVLVATGFGACKAAAPAPVPPAPAPTPTAPAKAEVVFGWLSDLTGRTSSIQVPSADGVYDYTKYINEVKGGITGKQGTATIKIDIWDTKYDVAKAKEAWTAGKEKGWVAVGHLLSGLAEGLVGEAEKDHIPVLCGSWGLKAPGSKWMFGTAHAGLPACGAGEGVMAGIKVAEALGKPKPKKVGFIGGDAPFGPMFAMGIDDWCKEQGVEVKAVLFPCGSPDVTADLLRLKDWGAEWLYGTCPISDHYVVQKCLKAMGWNVGLTVAN